MLRTNSAKWLAGVVLLAPLTALAQVGLPSAPASQTDIKPESGGQASFDLVKVTERAGIPLRYGKLRKGSEKIQFEGRTLQRDKDYTIDYESGTIYLKIQLRVGSSLQAEYRYDPQSGTQGTYGIGSSGTKFQGFTFAMTPQTSLVLGMGLTERLGDGTVLQSNVYGLNNAFSFNGGGLTGVMLVGDRQKAETRNLFGDEAAPTSQVEEGRSHAIYQNFTALSGKLQVSYQDIGDKFSGFQAFQSSGMDAGKVQQFQNEKGLKRLGLTADQIGSKSLNFSGGLKTVGDDNGAIVWRNFGLQALGWNLSWSAQRVENGFNRFANIAEGDRDQLARERGLDRQAVTAGKNWNGGALKYESTLVDDQSVAASLHRRSVSGQTEWLKFSFSDQHVEQGFTRFGDLREADRDQLSREVGLVREARTFELSPKVVLRSAQGDKPASLLPLGLKLDKNTIRTESGDMAAFQSGVQFGGFSYSHARLEIDPGFSALGSLGRDEIGSRLDQAVKMVDPGASVQGQDWNGWGQTAGLDRIADKVSLQLDKAGTLSASKLEIQGAEDSLKVDHYKYDSPKIKLSYRDQRSGDAFAEGGRLLFSEQQRLGTLPGFEKTDFDAKYEHAPGQGFNYSRMSAGDASGSLARNLLGFAGFGLNVSYVRRAVDPTFTGFGGLVDPERDFLASMTGFDNAELHAGWQVNKGLGMEFHQSETTNAATLEERGWSSASLKWTVDRLSQIVASRFTNKRTTTDGSLVDQQVDKYAVSKRIPDLGTIEYSKENARYDGKDDSLLDASKQTVAVTSDISKSTSVRTEHSQTSFENGERESTTSHTVSTALSPRVGVAVTDTQVRRDGDKPDEQHRDYGFWVDFGRNIRLNYKAKRDLRGETEGTLNNEVSVSPGEFQGLKVGSANYVRNGWDFQRDQHIGNVNLSNAKPLDWGWLKDVRFHYTVDSARDYEVWQKENRTMGFGARLGAFLFGYDYRAQTLPGGDRAIDRQVSFTTDVSGKSWLRGDMKYNVRTLPMGQLVTVRNYSLTAEPIKGVQIVHSLQTNPLQADGNSPLGETFQPLRVNKWSIAYDGDKRTKFGFSFEEFMNEQAHIETGATKLSLTLFADNPSPLYLEYAMAQTNEGGVNRRSHGFNIRFDQRPGPNQTLSFKFGNMNWELARPEGKEHQDWNLRLDYSLRF